MGICGEAKDTISMKHGTGICQHNGCLAKSLLHGTFSTDAGTLSDTRQNSQKITPQSAFLPSI